MGLGLADQTAKQIGREFARAEEPAGTEACRYAISQTLPGRLFGGVMEVAGLFGFHYENLQIMIGKERACIASNGEAFWSFKCRAVA